MEGFFSSCSILDENEIKDFLLKRYHSLNFLNEMEVNEFVEFYKFAIQKDKEEKIYLQWCAMLPTMAQYIPFNQFLDKMTGRNIDARSVEEIMADIEETHRKAKERADGS